MRLVSYLVGDRPAFGVMVGGGVVDAPSDSGCESMRQWIAKGLPGAVELARQPAQYALAEVRLLAPVTNPAQIVAIGLNTKSHFEETAVLKKRTPGDFPKYPRLFMRSPYSLAAPGEPIYTPRLSATLDYEGEIGLIISKKARNVAAENWRDVVLGFTCFNDGSVRGFQVHSEQVTAGKNFYRSGSWGPAIVTLDEIKDVDSLELTVDVNGKRRQHLNLDDLIFSFGELVSYISQPFELQPGDLIATGSPRGIGALVGNYLRPGDEVRISLLERGHTLLTLSNSVIED
jgi:2-keto-4-pentenoate hydratase/2-oxohepta-3-ene-1,7-dioic acid hydratase in catechol pathway